MVYPPRIGSLGSLARSASPAELRRGRKLLPGTSVSPRVNSATRRNGRALSRNRPRLSQSYGAVFSFLFFSTAGAMRAASLFRLRSDNAFRGSRGETARATAALRNPAIVQSDRLRVTCASVHTHIYICTRDIDGDTIRHVASSKVANDCASIRNDRDNSRRYVNRVACCFTQSVICVGPRQSRFECIARLEIDVPSITMTVDRD